MKNLAIIFTIVTFITGCGQTDYLVESDYAPEVDFDQFETYAFASQVRSNNSDLFLNNINLKTSIMEEVRGELLAKGYKHDAANPDIIVNFMVFDKPVKIQGYTQGDQGLYWDIDAIDVDNKRTYNLDAGTLIVDIVDSESNKVVWTGYASGIIKNNKFDTSEIAVAAAVEKIFENYNYRADQL